MIQFNLLPDVKKEYIKARRTKRLIITGSLLVSGISLGVVFLLFLTVQVAQKGNISDLTDDIQTELSTIQSIDDLDQMLTVQNQLNTLPGLHQDKPETSRLFDYLAQVTPEDVTISSLSLEMAGATMSISGRADSLATVNQFADTLKFSTYVVGVDEAESAPFTEVVTRLNRDRKGATYTIDFVFDPMIFNNTEEIELRVPSIVSTRSTTNNPAADLPQNEDVFDDTPITEEETQ